MSVSVTFLEGDCLARLRGVPDGSVHCVVTSPPYWGLRDYQVAGQIGLEATPEEFVGRMVEVFCEVRRVLRDDGVCWVNLGDSYVTGTAAPPHRGLSAINGQARGMRDLERMGGPFKGVPVGLKPKDLVGVPWRVAFALQGFAVTPFRSFAAWAEELRIAREAADWVAVNIVEGKLRQMDLLGALQSEGWWLRQDIIWHKPNPMPESIMDRCTKAHEFVFLLTKSARYWFDHEEIKEPVNGGAHPRLPGNKLPGKGQVQYAAGDERFRTREGLLKNAERLRKLAAAGSGTKNNESFDAAMAVMPDRRNKRSVWTVASQPYKESHFATFPEDLVKPMVLAGCPMQCCPKCGAGWKREVVRTDEPDTSAKGSTFDGGKTGTRDGGDRTQPGPRVKTRSIGFFPTCTCNCDETVPGTVLDPFGGSGTTGKVALELGRSAIIIELNPMYLKLARERLQITPAML